MKPIYIAFLFLSIIAAQSCNQKKSYKDIEEDGENETGEMTHDDSVYQQYLADEKAYAKYKLVKEDFIFPVPNNGSAELKSGGKLNTGLSEEAREATTVYEVYKAEIESAKEDSTTPMGCLMERSTYILSQDRHIMATYNKHGKLLTLHTSERAGDIKNEEDFMFKDGRLFFYSHEVEETHDTEGILTRDNFYLNDNKVAYAFREFGTGPVNPEQTINFIDVDKFLLIGDWTAAVTASEKRFKQCIELLKDEDFRSAFYYTAE